ncbi:sulfite reductase (NADPH) flavoprotein alpha-component [Verrucomicrobium sp. GAS474]|uniref:flavodoxin domain-containing protein n=1 Tax=Verrucomicrobium sp. GAS474 TaxID=1882831 RepID=UPI00087CD642|nr:flavodoxin domain-containing protein [Verrucomicrobium sp. GAS474]SDT87353.1 sulfite reductase (NADPH) flavoprotein alpha-component [Verrucomicrobium sp. GAS474]
MSKEVTILFGTTTGNAEDCAKKTAEKAASLGFLPRLENMAGFTPEKLKAAGLVLIVTSTWGDGEPPDDAIPFWDKMAFLTPGSLNGVGYGVLALGDSSYEQFCGFGRIFDEKMERLGATRLCDRIECDVDYSEPLEVWLERLPYILAVAVMR